MTQFFINLGKETSERYDMSVFMDFTDNFDPLTSSFITDLKSLRTVGTFEVQSESSRPDLISYKIYNDLQYWWILLVYNDIISNEDIAIGTIIKYPSVRDLESLYFSLKSKEKSK